MRSAKTLQNTDEQTQTATHVGANTDASTETSVLAASPKLTGRQENFARLYAETGVALDAYATAYDCEGSSRATVRVNAHRLLRNPWVAARVRVLQEAAAGRSLRSTASLIRDLEEMVEADISELMRLDVGACRHCHGVGGAYQWKDLTEYLAAMTKALNASAPLPDDAGGYGYRLTVDPNPECNECGGVGVPRAVFSNSADVSPGVRKLVRGIELHPDGSVKRLTLHDQSALRVELHKLRGLHIDRSVSVTAHVHVEPLKDMTEAELIEMIRNQRRIDGVTVEAEELTP